MIINASDLDNLDYMAAQADSGAEAIDALARGPELDSNGQPIQPPSPTDYHTEAAGMVDVFAALLVGYAPQTESIWTGQAKTRTAQALAPVLEKYGVTLGGMPPELTLLIVAGPLLWQSSRVVAAQMAEAKRPAAARVEEGAAPGQPKPDALNPDGPDVLRHAQVILYP
jgi:hypothetical protein